MPTSAVHAWLPLKNNKSSASSVYQIPRHTNTKPITMDMFLAKYESVNFFIFFIVFYYIIIMRARGIGPRSVAWEATVLPLNYARAQ